MEVFAHCFVDLRLDCGLAHCPQISICKGKKKQNKLLKESGLKINFTY
jgi:hypothetical protein